ncbi:hypothetical protein ABK046_52910, partial [Streptomyces caeruleatus]
MYEPQAKNTGPALAFLCKILEMENHPDKIVGVFPADQILEKESSFKTILSIAQEEAAKGSLVTLGILP